MANEETVQRLEVERAAKHGAFIGAPHTGKRVEVDGLVTDRARDAAGDRGAPHQR